MYIFFRIIYFFKLTGVKLIVLLQVSQNSAVLYGVTFTLTVEPAGRKLHYSGAPEVAKAAEESIAAERWL